MTTVEVFDPAMCCSTGVCGPDVDPVLVRFNADFHWLVREGVHAERYNLSQQPQAFLANPLVKATLNKEGTDCLPLIVVNGAIVCKGRYPTRTELAKFTGVTFEEPATAAPFKVIRSKCCG